MAYRTEDHSDLSLFKNRLWKLMEAHGIYTAKELAKELYHNGLVSVKQKPNYESIEKNEGNAIGAVEKKIQVHLKSDTTDKLQGEYVSAYCRLFSCSADFLFGHIGETTHDIHYISQETGLTETSIRNIQEMWLKTLVGDEITLGVWNNSEETPELQYRKNAVQSAGRLHEYWKKHGQSISGYKEDPECYLSKLVKEKKEKSRTLSALNILLSSPTGKAILENIYAFLHFEYEPSEEEKEKTREFNTKHGTGYKSVIKGKNGYVNSEYLNNSFLVSIQNNCAKLKEEITKKDRP